MLCREFKASECAEAFIFYGEGRDITNISALEYYLHLENCENGECKSFFQSYVAGLPPEDVSLVEEGRLLVKDYYDAGNY
jgi:hypothetical protein